MKETIEAFGQLTGGGKLALFCIVTVICLFGSLTIVGVVARITNAFRKKKDNIKPK